MPTPITKPDRRELRLQAIARQIIRHGFAAEEVARALAIAALEYSERNLDEAACVLGLPAGSIAAVLGARDAEVQAAIDQAAREDGFSNV